MRPDRAALFLVTFGFATAARPAEPRSFGPVPRTGTSAAVRVDDVPQAHTTQILPLDAKGVVVGKGKAGEQIGRVLDNLGTALSEAGSGLDRVVKVNVYVARADLVGEVEKAFALRFKGPNRPAAAFVVTPLPHPDALVGLDAVAITTSVKRTPRVATLPAGSRVYVSGQAEKGKDLGEATRKTLEGLNATLKHLGLTRDDVVQAKAFLVPMREVEAARKELAAFFGDRVPPLTFVEWESTLPIEIELVVAAGKETRGPVLEFITPPGMTASPVYARVVRINRGPTIYVGGLYGKGTPAEEVENAFAALATVLKDVDGDMRHLAKATYYVSTDAVSKHLNELRPKYYDPRRPPAASKAKVAGVGRAGTLTLDMIAVPAPRDR